MVYLALVCGLVAILVGFAALTETAGAKAHWDAEFSQIEARVLKTRAQSLLADRRRAVVSGISRQIANTNPKLSVETSKTYATWLVDASEKYPSVDPLFFLSIGIVESRFDPRATSWVNARGLYQIWPPTGEKLARQLGWEYEDALLYDPKRNTEMAALYLDILFSAYNDERMVMAEYNGGPLNAGYYRARSGRIAFETKDYVYKVSREYDRLKLWFNEYEGSGWELPPLTERRPGAQGVFDTDD